MLILADGGCFPEGLRLFCRANGTLYALGATPMQPANLSNKQAIGFWAKGRHTGHDDLCRWTGMEAVHVSLLHV